MSPNEMVRIVGVYIGEWVDDTVYAIFHGSRGYQYLSRRDEDMAWEIIAVRDKDGVEMPLEVPAPAPDPIEVSMSIVRGDDDFTVALDEARNEWGEEL